MKKFYTMLSVLLAGAMTLSAQQTVFIGTTGYDDIAAAVAAAAEGDVITVKADQTFAGKRIDLVSKQLTIKGEGNVKLIRGEGNINNMFFLCDKGQVNFENLTFDGSSVEGTKQAFIEAKNGCVTAIKDCTFANATFKAVQVKAPVTLTNVKAVNCSAPEGSGTFYVGENNKFTVAGTADYTIFIEKGFSIMQGENLSGKVSIKLPADKFTVGYTVVKGGSDPSLFALVDAPEGYVLEAKDGNLVMAYSKPVIKNESTGASYTSVDAALAAAVANEDGSPVVLTLLESTTVADRMGAQKFPITIKAAAEDIVLTKNFANKLFVSNNSDLTFEGITLDCADKNEKFANEFEANQNNATLAFVNCKIINCNATTYVFSVKEGNRTLLLDNTTGEIVTAPNGVNLNGKIVLKGNTNFSITKANGDAKISVDGALTNEAPIALSLPVEVPAKGDIIVYGCEDASKFTIDLEGWVLAAAEGNLVLAEKVVDGIAGIAADADTTVDVYNMQGIRVKAGVAAEAAAEGLAPGMYIAGGRKIVVR